jgi:hypothetical protein
MVKVNPYSKQLKEQEDLKSDLNGKIKFHRKSFDEYLAEFGYLILQKKTSDDEKRFYYQYIPDWWLRTHDSYGKTKKEYINRLKDEIRILSKLHRQLDQCEKQIIYLEGERDKLDYIRCEEKE